MNKYLLLIVFLYAAPAWAVPTHDATNTFTDTAVASVGGTHTRGGVCANPVAVISVAYQASTPTALSGVTYGGNDAIFQAGVDVGSIRLEMWSYKNPASGAATVTATLADIVNSLTERVSTYCGVDQTVTYGSPVTNTGSDTMITVDASSATGELVVDAVVIGSTAMTMTVGSGQTQRANFYQDITNHVHGGSEKAGAATVNMYWDIALSDNWGSIALPLKAVIVAPTGSAKRKIIIVM